MATDERGSSSGHKLGQLVGDWFEQYFVVPLLQEVADHLNLFLDTRFLDRSCRRGKILWVDEQGNAVDYDCVLEIGGTDLQRGVPIAFIESFWRRGARHSKDKARDDSGKLLPMRGTYPTARFLGIVAAGDFTGPARELVKNREIDLFYVPKDKIIQAFADQNLIIDYSDTAREEVKLEIANNFMAVFTTQKKLGVASALIDLIGIAAVHSYTDRVRARLSALPQELRIILRHQSNPLVFASVEEVTVFLKSPTFGMANPRESFIYEVVFSDGSEFRRDVETREALETLHKQMCVLVDHAISLDRRGHI